MRFRFAALPALALALGIAALAQDSTNPAPPSQESPAPPSQAPQAGHPMGGRYEHAVRIRTEEDRVSLTHHQAP